MVAGKYIFQTTSAQTIPVNTKYTIVVVTSSQQFLDFHTVPWEVYKDDPHWVPPLRMEMKAFFSADNPFWKHTQTCLFVAYKEKKPVGRIATFIDSFYPGTQQENIGFFGFFECIHDNTLAHALFQAAETWLKEHGMKRMQGPIQGRIDVGCGFTVEGFDIPPAVLVSYTPRYYLDFVKEYTMKKARDQLVYKIDLTQPIPPRVIEAKERCEKEGFRLRSFRRFHIKKEFAWWLPLMKETFASHWGYVEVSDEEVTSRFGIKQLFWTVDPNLFMITENKQGEPIAFKWSIPDYNQLFKDFNGKMGISGMVKFLLLQRRIAQGKFNFVGIQKDYRGQGIGTFMNYYTLQEMKRRGYKTASCGWIDEKNIASQKTIEKAGARPFKRFRVFEKMI